MKILKKHRSYVAYFDILGFKSAVEHNINKACEALEEFRISLSEFSNISLIPETTKIPIVPAQHLYLKFFSDSFVLYTHCDNNENLLSIVFVATRILMLNNYWRVPIRGGLAHGELYANEQFDLLCGESLVRAYQLGECSQWIGLVIDEFVAETYKKSPLVKNNDADSIMIKWDVNFKIHCEIKRRKVWVANWPPRMEYKINDPMSGEQLYEVFKILFNQNFNDLRDDIRQKYDNTVNFINYTNSVFKQR